MEAGASTDKHMVALREIDQDAQTSDLFPFSLMQIIIKQQQYYRYSNTYTVDPREGLIVWLFSCHLAGIKQKHVYDIIP